MGKPTNISPENKAIARQIAKAFGGIPHVHEYVHDTVDLSVGVLSSEDCPVKGVTSYGTIRLSDYPMQYNKGEFPTRLELVGACAKTQIEFANVLAAVAFCVMRTGMLIAPGSILRGYVAEYFPDVPVPHLYFAPPFLWQDELRSTVFGPKRVSWLLMVPISEAEAVFREKNGDSALESLFEEKKIDIYNLNRESVI